MKIGIAADHGGFEMKQALLAHYSGSADFELVDYGTHSLESVDYPDVAAPVCRDTLAGKLGMGILICGTGIGISIAANRFRGIRAALLYDDFVAKMARAHNDANVAVFGGRTMAAADAIRRFDMFRATAFEAGRHERRVCKIDGE